MNWPKLIIITFFATNIGISVNAINIEASKNNVKAANKYFRSKISQLPSIAEITQEQNALEAYINTNWNQLKTKQASMDFANLSEREIDAYENEVLELHIARNERINAFNEKLKRYLKAARALDEEYQNKKNTLARELKQLRIQHLESNEFNQIGEYINILIRTFENKVTD